MWSCMGSAVTGSGSSDDRDSDQKLGYAGAAALPSDRVGDRGAICWMRLDGTDVLQVIHRCCHCCQLARVWANLWGDSIRYTVVAFWC